MKQADNKVNINGIIAPLPELQRQKLGASREEDNQDGMNSPFARLQNDLEILVNDDEEDQSERLRDSPELGKTERGSSNGAASLQSSTYSLNGATGGIFSKGPPAKIFESNGGLPAGSAGSAGGSSLGYSRSLWIGNLDPTVTQDELQHVFEPFGEIESLRLLPTKECAFVNFVVLDEAIRAKETLQGVAIGNMIVRIGFGKTEGSNGGSTSGPSESRSTPQPVIRNGSTPANGSQDLSSRSVWVGGIDPDCQVPQLIQAFSSFGAIESCRILDTKNCAFVNFASAADAEVARKKMHGARLGTSVIKTGFAKGVGGLSAGLPSKDTPIMATMMMASDDAAVSLKLDCAEDDFIHPIPTLPTNLGLSDDLNGSVIRECRRRVEHQAVSQAEVDNFAEQISGQLLAASVDPVGNILVQKLIEKGSEPTRSRILAALAPYMAAVGIHKNGTWVVQKLITYCGSGELRDEMAESLRAYIVPLMQDQFGNYVVQGCLSFGPVQNQFIFDALFHRCVEIGTSRFGSRAMKSCLDSLHVSGQQKRFVAMALISEALKLVHDANGVIVIQWLLDSDLPGRHAFIAPVLRGHFVSLCLSKHASAIVAKLIQPGIDATARELVIEEIFSPSALPTLLGEPMAAAIIRRTLVTAQAEQRIRLAHLLEPQLSRLAAKGLPHLQKLEEETREASEIVKLDTTTTGGKKGLEMFGASHGGPSNYAVGGPVSSRSGHKPSVPVAASSRILSFGTVNTVIDTGLPRPDRPSPLSPQLDAPISAALIKPSRTKSSAEMVPFGPSLLKQFKEFADRDRPPTPS